MERTVVRLTGKKGAINRAPAQRARDLVSLLKSSKKATLGSLERAWRREFGGGDAARRVRDAVGQALALGVADVELECRGADLKTFYRGTKAGRAALLRRKPGYWNLAGSEEEWRTCPEYCDFLSASSPVHARKRFQTEVYMRLLEPFIGRLPAGGRILDAGCGVGRFAVEFGRRGFEVALADCSPSALKSAWKRLAAAGIKNYEIFLADAAELDFLPSGSVDAVLATELICYSTGPEGILRSLHRVLKPGGMIFLSVENKWGALAGDGRLEVSDAAMALAEDEVRIENYLYVRYYGAAGLRGLLAGTGFRVDLVRGCQYTADGFFDRAAEKIFEGGGGTEALHGLEGVCSRHSALRNFHRAWLAVARKKKL